MSDRAENQRKSYEFLRRKFEDGSPFSEREFFQASGFTKGSFKTYWTKHFRTLLKSLPDRMFVVRGVFRQFRTFEEFRDRVVTQNRSLAREYCPRSFPGVLIFEFFMPLRNEEALRGTLDALFFRDTVLSRIRRSKAELTQKFAVFPDEQDEEFLERLCIVAGEKFGGYSIDHCSGRFRVGDLKSKAEVFRDSGMFPERYLIDETTAVVRFIVPLHSGDSSTVLEQQADEVWHLFKVLFVDSILELVNAEDEVWLVESGLRSRLHVWAAKS